MLAPHPLLPPMTLSADMPIGIFDSGIGGLTVARALATRLPSERFVYFGDTAHLPYGDKSVAALQAYSVKITDLLLRVPVKTLLVACFSATSAAADLIAEYAGPRARVINVVDPAVAYVANRYAGRRVGLIGTRRTVESNTFRSHLWRTGVSVDLRQLATPLLAAMIEEGFHQNQLSRDLIHTYLSHPDLAGIEALVLGCTHYPLIAPLIAEYYGPGVEVIDASDLAAAAVEEHLSAQGLLAPALEGGATPAHQVYVSDLTRSFEQSVGLFFGKDLPLQHYPIW